MDPVFKVADISKRNLVSWEDFVVFESRELPYDDDRRSDSLTS